ncbi:hypothetical protein SAICODRAFT_32243 [Saitoella complicata NRRL Y-17804]|nr:uncharacterized protein SAICODRAFT_32243 [Saitoella complicata NRRL Y-17804]ODQ49948.1 hypothetical protein SAICODRAFT_32243 [Saitoella complicata NRRL Y-17804]
MAEEMKGYIVRYPKLARNIVFTWEDHDVGIGERAEIAGDDERYVAWEHLVRQVALSRNHSERIAENMVDDLRVKFRTLGLNDRPPEDTVSAKHAEIAAFEALRKGRIHAERIIGLSNPSSYACGLVFDAVNARLKHSERYAVTSRSGHVQLTEPPDVDAGSMQRATNKLCETLMNQIEMKLAEDDDEDDDDEDEEGTASEVERTMQKMDALLKKMSGDKRIKK